MYTITILKDGHWITIATLPYTFDFEAIKELTKHYDAPVDDIAIEDAKTGEVYWDYQAEGYGDEPDYDEPDDWCAEMGFDPYEGCWTGDC